MKTILFVAFTVILVNRWIAVDCNNNDTAVKPASTRERFMEMVGRKLKSLWSRFSGEENRDTFMGRCFGIAKRLRMIMPLAIFKLGVIVTILAFLTIFSLKTLGLLGLLLLINVSGAISKISLAFASKHNENKTWKPPQTVHFHVHQEKEGHGHYYTDHTSPGWDDRVGKHAADEDLNRLESYNLYNKLSRNPFSRNYRATHR